MLATREGPGEALQADAGKRQVKQFVLNFQLRAPRKPQTGAGLRQQLLQALPPEVQGTGTGDNGRHRLKSSDG